MKKTDWFKDAIIYQIYPRSFCDANGDGLGDIPGIISKLDYLKDLGVNCVWLSPVYDSPQEDNGYDISNYRDIYKPFGTLDDFKKMLSEMHKRGIRLITDLVVNHTSSEHQWFKSAMSDKNSPYRDYYIIRKGRRNGKKPPNNWSGFFSEKAWEKIDDENYYLHLFAKGQPDLNWENPKVREEVKDILRYWLDMGVDGFRCDVITLISKDQRFKSVFPTIAIAGKQYFINGPRLHEYLHELNKDVLSHYDCMTVGETVLSTVDQARLLVEPKREELSMIFNFDHTDTDNFFGAKWLYRKFKLKRLKKVINRWQQGLHDSGWNSLFIENHDQRRSVGRFGTDDKEYRYESSTMLGATYFFLQGTPFIYQGQEIGMTNGDFKSMDDLRDVEAKNVDALTKKLFFLRPLIKKHMLSLTRDNARTPMQWDNSKYAGFSKVEPWIKVNANKETINTEADINSDKSINRFYRSLIEFRKGNDVIKNGEYICLNKSDNKVFIYKRVLGEKEIVVVSNFTKKEIKVKYLDKLDKHNLVLFNYQNKTNKLLPFETRVYKNY
jgi:oligo-1,6-glucosidase